MIFLFNNNTGKYKFSGSFVLNNSIPPVSSTTIKSSPTTIKFNYELYLLNKLNKQPYESEIVSYFGDRFVNGERCLGITPEYMKQYVTNTSGYLKVYKDGEEKSDVASCSLKIQNPCSVEQTINTAQLYIYDLCRVKTHKITTMSPIYGLFYFIEQLAYQNLGKNHIYLMVNNTVELSKNKLIKIYNSYGFSVLDKKKECALAPNTREVLVKKYNIPENNIPENTKLDLSWLLKHPVIKGGKRSRFKKTKRNYNNYIRKSRKRI